jgi:predicted DNA-binding transcriptional regulator AlpA
VPVTAKCAPASPDQPAAPADWLSPAQLADWLGVPVRSVYVWNQLGTGPRPTKIGKHVRYSRQAVASWLAEQGRGPE